jgi:hypothetical protein
LQQAWGARVEDSARDVDVRDGIAVEEDFSAAEIVEEREDRDGEC